MCCCGVPMSDVPAAVRLLGVDIHPMSASELVATLVRWGEGDRLRKVFNVNVHAMNLAADDRGFATELARADLVFCDGVGVQLGARLAGVTLAHRTTPPDWIDAFADATAAAQQSVFALGDEDGVAQAFQDVLVAAHPTYRPAGSAHGFFAKQGRENDAVIAAINASEATHLLVGFGMPLQEKWIAENASRLRVRTAIAVGALFRWHAGFERRAPGWMTDRGLEWLARFAQHPVRHFRRYAIGNPRFLWRVLRAR